MMIVACIPLRAALCPIELDQIHLNKNEFDLGAILETVIHLVPREMTELLKIGMTELEK